MPKLLNQAKVIVLALALALGISYVSAAGTWAPPTAVPPGGMVDVPLNVGSNAQIKAGDLGVGAFLANLNSQFLGNVTIGTTTSPAQLRLVNGTQGAGKVLTSDANGNATWAESSGGGGGSLDSMCNTVDSGVAYVGVTQISLLIGGKNMCSDLNGCSYRIWAYDTAHPEGYNFYGSSPLMVRQDSVGNWVDSSGNNSNVNGNSTATAFFSSWGGLVMYDDLNEAGGEMSKDAFTLKDSSNAKGFVATICDL